MAVGWSVPTNEDNANSTLEMPPNQTIAHIPRPFNSPRLLPRKRPLEIELVAEWSPAKHSKPEVQRSVQHVENILLEAPEMKNEKQVELKPDQPEIPQKFPSHLGPQPHQSLEKAVEVAMHLFKEYFTVYVLEKDVKGEDEADKFGEAWAADHYEELKNAILSLVPWAGEMKANMTRAYDMIQFQGRKTTRREICKRQLQHFRAEGEQARAWEALCAVFAIIASRVEKNWVEHLDVDLKIKQMLKKMPPQCQDKLDVTRRAAIRDMIPKLMEEGAGAFAETLIDPRMTHVVTFARGPAGPLPATSMTTRRMPLWDALKCMDDEGPLRGAAADKEWCWGAGRQFALQDLHFDESLMRSTLGRRWGYSRKERISGKNLQPDPKLRDLLRSKRPVVLLDTLAALAPREICKNNGLSEIVKAELATLFREAKARGEAVVLSIGSDVPHKLAKKVYLRPPLADYGMRCGCLRWRASADVPWAREFKWDDRITLCLQMP